MLCGLLVAPSFAHPSYGGAPEGCTATQFRVVAKQLYQPWYQPVRNRWRLHKMKSCAPNDRTRAGMNKAHRKLARGKVRAVGYYRSLTPYGRWAIPGWCVYAESGGSWSAHNPTSPARGPYQLLSHGEPWPVLSMADKMAHHEIARDLYLASGLQPWVAC